MSLTKQIVQRMIKTKFEDIPEKSLQAARFVILDSVGSAIAGANTDVGKRVIDLLSKGAPGASLAWGTNTLTSLNTACFVNSHSSQILDFDDTYEIKTLAVSHPGPAIVPLSLTMAAALNCKGPELLRAIVLGYEICMRFSDAIEPRDDDYFGFSNSQILGSVTAASVLLGLDEEAFINALGLAVSTSPIGNTKAMWSLDNRPMSWIKDGVGFISTTALTCAQMASIGFSATREALDPSNKYYKLCGSKAYKTEALTEDLGSKFKIHEISYKPYPTCRFMQSTLDTVKNIVADNNINGDSIEKIQINITPYLLQSFNERRPSSIVDAQFSLPYAISMIVARNVPSVGWYSSEVMNNPYILSIMDKVELTPDFEAEKRRGEGEGLSMDVILVLKNGQIHKQKTGFGRGNPANPVSKEDHIAKFLENMAEVFESEKSLCVAEEILGIGKTSEIQKLISMLRRDQ